MPGKVAISLREMKPLAGMASRFQGRCSCTSTVAAATDRAAGGAKRHANVSLRIVHLAELAIEKRIGDASNCAEVLNPHQ